MKKVAIAFVSVFCLFFLVGLMQEWVTARDREFLKRVARQNLHIVQRDSSIFLRYECHGTTLYVYDVDRQTVTMAAAAFAPLANAASKELPTDTVKTGLFTVMLGGGAWSARDAVAMMRSEDKSAAAIVAAVAGALSGYTAGRYVGLRGSARSACDGPGVMAILSEDDAWRSLSRDAYMILLMESTQRAQRLARDFNMGNNFTAMSRLSELQRSAAKRYPSFIVTSPDFVALTTLEHQLRTPTSNLPTWKRVIQYTIVTISVIFTLIGIIAAWVFVST